MKPSNWHFARRETFATKAILDAFDNVVTGMSDETDSTTHDIAAGMTFFAQFVARKARLVMVFDGFGDLGRQAIVAGVVAAHDALQFRKLTYHVR